MVDNIDILEDQKRALNFILNHIAKAIQKDCITGWESNIEINPTEPTIETIILKINRTILDHTTPQPITEESNHRNDPVSHQTQNGHPVITNRWQIGDIITDARLERLGPVPEHTVVRTFRHANNERYDAIIELPRSSSQTETIADGQIALGRPVYHIEGHDFFVGMHLPGDVPWIIPIRVHCTYISEHNIFEVTDIYDDQNNQSIRSARNGEEPDGRARVRAAQDELARCGIGNRVREGTNMGPRYTQAQVNSADLRNTERQVRRTHI